MNRSKTRNKSYEARSVEKSDSQAFVRRRTALILASTVVAQEKKPSPPVKLTDIRKHLGELQTRIAETTESLDQLKKAARSGSDLLPSYTAFDNQLKELESQIAKVRAESTRMRARADDNYRAW